MHPILAHRERLTLYLAVWLIIAVLLAVLLSVSGTIPMREALVFSIPLAIVYAFMSLSALYVCKAFPLDQTGFIKLCLISLGASTLSASLWNLVAKAWSLLLAWAEPDSSVLRAYESSVPFLFGGGVLLFLLATVVHYLLLAFEASRTAERTALELKVLAREAELKSLRAQIHPHFLFNSLNSISALTTSDPAAARTMSLRLAEYLRKTLVAGRKEHIPLSEELLLLQEYLGIEQIRFGKRLQVRVNIDDESKLCIVPSLFLQPLVENAVGHGIAHLLDGGIIEIEARRNGRRLTITIANQVDPDHIPTKGNGIGIQNVKQRLEALYGTEARIDIEKTSSTFRVVLSLPALQDKQ